MLKLLSILFLSFVCSGAYAEDLYVDAQGVPHGLGLLRDDSKHGKVFFSPKTMRANPPSLDLRQSKAVSKIKDQGSCGSCWSFAITKSLESARMRAGLPELDLGEQEMVSCEKDAYGCNGGFMDSANYVVKRGLSSEADYPYTATSSRCKNPLPPVADKAVSWAYVGGSNRRPSVEELKTALNTYGALFVTVAAGGADWNGSRVHMTGCGNRQTNHMVTIVGYNEQDEFIIGNSWGDSWAENGFAYAKLGCNALADEAAFIVYDQGPAPVPPKVALPKEIISGPDVDLPIGVKTESGVTYSWFVGANKVGSDPLIWVSPKEDTIYKLVASNRAGVAETTLLVRVKSGPPTPPPGPKPSTNECWRTYDELAFCVGTSNNSECLIKADVLRACVL